MLNKKTIRDFDVKGKKVLVRVDFNVPLEEGKITDDTRIKAALPTIEYLLENGAAVILASHLGRPEGEAKNEFSLKPVAEYLDNLIEGKVYFSNDCIGDIAANAVKKIKYGEVLVLENTRFHPGEETNDPNMSKELASLGELFVNDAFGTAHRAHASNVGVADYLPAAAGFLLEKEINYLDNAIADPKRPFVAILGGAKVGGKIRLINNLLDKVDSIIIGGGMANTFFAAQGFKMGDSLVEKDALEIARELLEKAKGKMSLPVDITIANEFSNDAEKRVMEIGDIPDGWRILDIGPASLVKFGKIISTSATIVWNGPMGVFEFPNFAGGTFALAKEISESKAITIVGGGDSAAAIVKSGLSDKITHISTGGGASLQMLEGEKLPGVEALEDK
jgi:phosphoglycerate kinase